jgi:hypothetical protein
MSSFDLSGKPDPTWEEYQEAVQRSLPREIAADLLRMAGGGYHGPQGGWKACEFPKLCR